MSGSSHTLLAERAFSLPVTTATSKLSSTKLARVKLGAIASTTGKNFPPSIGVKPQAYLTVTMVVNSLYKS
ncbi:hypothetical protein [Laspinema olomoucense]|uniref:hypothetical protein n=1 Tax=Laspinema olomoucense TaxID=3231600 RepID=UPI0021BB74E7|nr:hypothetical protein [Laspinema sp. D3c]MCT7994998.1 hypothetical protein [Laspinema sp. D3c]